MATMSFRVNDASTGGTNPTVWVSVTENPDGTLAFNVTQEGGIVGDLRGLFFDVNAVSDGTLAKSLSISGVTATSTLKTGDDSIKDLGSGANMNGLLGSEGGFDAGISIGSAGLGSDDIRSFSFTLASSVKPLTLDDFANVDFGVRLTSVGILGGDRSASSKLLEVTSASISAFDDTSSVSENTSVTGNLLSNDANKLGATSVTAWSGGAMGQTIALDNAAGATLTVNADGIWTLDASAADALGADEVLTYHFSYTATSASADQISSDTAGFTVTVHGQNDGQINGDDVGAVDENSTATGNVLGNDRDIDRTDSHITVANFSGGALGSAVAIANAEGAAITLNANGDWVLDASNADRLGEGEAITQTFTYDTTDGHGGSGSAQFTVTVNGRNDGPVASDDNGGVAAEDAMLAGNVTTNDSDIDRGDSHTWALVEGSLTGLGQVNMNADGTWSYDSQGAYNYLNDGQGVDLSFQYAMTDNHGASDLATVVFRVNGVGSVEPPPPPPPPHDADDFPTWAQDISHFTLVFDQTAGDAKPRVSGGDGYYTVKVDVDSDFNDDLDASISTVLAALVEKDPYVTAESDLMGSVIKGGLQSTQFYTYGDYNTNGTAADALPDGIGFSLEGHLTERPANAIDQSYSYDWLMA